MMLQWSQHLHSIQLSSQLNLRHTLAAPWCTLGTHRFAREGPELKAAAKLCRVRKKESQIEMLKSTDRLGVMILSC